MHEVLCGDHEKEVQFLLDRLRASIHELAENAETFKIPHLD